MTFPIQSFSGPSMAKLGPIHIVVQGKIRKTGMKAQNSAVFASAFDAGFWGFFVILRQNLLSPITINKADSNCCHLGLGEHLGLDTGHPFLPLGLEHPFPGATRAGEPPACSSPGPTMMEQLQLWSSGPWRPRAGMV